MFGVAFRLMHDVGFTPEKGGRPLAEMRKIAADSIEYGWRVPAVKWLMVESLVTGGVGIYAFYALQPYLLELYGDPHAYQIAGLVAAIVAGAQIVGGLAAPRIRGRFGRRTSALIADRGARASLDARPDRRRRQLLGRCSALIVVWGLLFAASMPIRQTYLNGLIPSRQRATILSFDSMMSSTGGRLDPAGARPRRRRLGLRALLPAGGRDLDPGRSLPRPVAPPERPRRHPRADRHHIGAVCFNRMTRERRWSYVDSHALRDTGGAGPLGAARVPAPAESNPGTGGRGRSGMSLPIAVSPVRSMHLIRAAFGRP